MAQPVDLQKLEDLVRPAVEGQGYDFVDLAWRKERSRWIFQVTIDRKPGEGFVSHEDCIQVSREVSALLDVHDVLPGFYHLEVSSPGPERPLKKTSDFTRFQNHRVKIRLKVHAAMLLPGSTVPRRNFVGVLQGFQEGKIELCIDDRNQNVQMRHEDVEKAHLVD